MKTHVDKAGLSIADLAKLTGWHELRVGRLMRNKTRLLAKDMELLARVLGKDVCLLYRDAL